jgi:prepilin-type N-terminal cleavage/methylation domain-containing protein
MAARISRSKGFTLVEVAVTMVIVALAAVGLLTSFVMGRLHSGVARHRNQAINLIRARIEEVKSKGYDYLNGFDPNPSVETGVVVDIGQDGESPSDDLTCTRTTHITDTDADGVLEIALTVDWQERLMSGEQDFSESLFTIVAPTRVTDR